MKSRHLLALIMSLLILAASSCSKPEIDSATTQGKDNVSASQSKTQDGELSFKQLDPPQKGEEIAQLTTNYGVIKMRLFPQEAPLAVENFKTLIGQGYYDGLTFHRVIDNFMIQGGDPTGTGAGGESCWGEDFAIELSKELFHFRGALSMANTGRPNSNSCQFFIVQNPTADKSQFDMMEQYGYPVDNIPDSVKEKYAQVGGTPNLDANYYPEDLGMVGYTVFGQVFDGMDVVDAIAAVETDSGDKPVSDVVIEKAEIVTYNG